MGSPTLATVNSAITQPDPDLALSLVRDDPAFRTLRRLGMVPRTGLGLVRRAVLLALIAWLPIAIWAWLAGRALPGAPGEPLLEHFGVHARGLVAIPMLILAQGLAHHITTSLLPWFVRSGVIAPDKRAQFGEVVRGVARLRDAMFPWLVMGSLVLAWTAIGPVLRNSDELSWAMDSTTTPPTFGFGGWWFLFVARPIYVALVLAWIWRVVLLTLLFVRTARLGLELVPTHPDRVGGLGFVERFTTMFSPVVFVLSVVIAAHWAHQVLYHDLQVQTLRTPAAAFLILTLIVFLAPLLVFAGPLAKAKREAELEYGTLAGEHGDVVRKRWVFRKPVADDGLLDAPKIGPVADTASLFKAVTAMRQVPLGKRALLAIALPAVLPLLAVFAIRVPVREVLEKLLHAVA